jgi:hypothetical protein
MFEVHRNVAFGQWRGCRFFVHIGSTCWTFGDTGRDGYAAGIELFTPSRWLRIRRSKARG